MKLLVNIGALCLAALLVFSCGREDDEELYQVQYKSPVDSVMFDESSFMITPSTVTLGDTVKFSSDNVGQEVSWILELSQTTSEDEVATKTLVFVADALSGGSHYWTGDYNDGSVPFDSTEAISVNVSIYRSDVVFNGGVITLK